MSGNFSKVRDFLSSRKFLLSLVSVFLVLALAVPVLAIGETYPTIADGTFTKTNLRMWSYSPEVVKGEYYTTLAVTLTNQATNVFDVTLALTDSDLNSYAATGTGYVGEILSSRWAKQNVIFYTVPTDLSDNEGSCTNLLGEVSDSPVTLVSGSNTITVSTAGTLTIVVPAGSTAVATSGTAPITDSPVTLAAGSTVITAEDVGDFTIVLTNPSADDDVFAIGNLRLKTRLDLPVRLEGWVAGVNVVDSSPNFFVKKVKLSYSAH